MARKCAQVVSCKDQGSCKLGSGYPQFRVQVSKGSLWTHGVHSPSWPAEEPRRRGLAQSHNDEVCEKDEATSFVALLKVCTRNKELCRGIVLHDDILKRGLLKMCSDALVTMYAKCGALAQAKELLNLHKSRDVPTWNALIGGYTCNDQGQDALDCFEQMKGEGLSPDAVTFSCILKACGSLGAVDKGEQIHDQIARQRLLEHDCVLGNSLVSMYAKCGALAKARQVLEELHLRNVVTWNAVIAGYVEQRDGEHALSCFEEMRREGLCPDAVTFNCILVACGSIGAADKGQRIHDEIVEQGLLRNNILLGSALVSMYAKCGALPKARQVLEELRDRNAICWNALITAYSQHGEAERVFDCFQEMQCNGLSPDAVTFICILKACCGIGAADKGELVHSEIAKQGLLRDNVVLGTALVDMYAKCGAFAKARQVLEELPVWDVISWNALIAGSVQRGEAEQTLSFFKQMKLEGLLPDAATFSCILTACNRLGLVEDALTYFADMRMKYGLVPDVGHYTCMVDLFGRSGQLDKAKGLIEEMPSFDSGVWSALLGACQKWGDVKTARWIFDRALQLDEGDVGIYHLMETIYAGAGMQKEEMIIKCMRLENGKP